MVRQPLHGGVGEHDVGRTDAARVDGPNVAKLETQAVSHVLRRFVEHGLRVVDTKCLGGSDARVQGRRQFTGAAAEVEHPRPLDGVQQAGEVPERL